MALDPLAAVCAREGVSYRRELLRQAPAIVTYLILMTRNLPGFPARTTSTPLKRFPPIS